MNDRAGGGMGDGGDGAGPARGGGGGPGPALRGLGRIVPGDVREEWLREWAAELAHGAGLPPPGASSGPRRLRKLVAAAEDALRLRLRSLRGATSFRDVRFGARTLVRNPLFTGAVVLTLGLGVGANAAMFTVVDAVLLEPLPYPDAERIVRLERTGDGEAAVRIATPDFDDLAERVRTVRLPSLWVESVLTYQGDRPVRLEAAGVSSGFFRLFGTTPHLGRYLLPTEDGSGHEPVAVLSYGLWQRVFGGERGVVGRTIRLNDQPYVVVGVAEPGFRDPAGDVELWTSRPAWIEFATRDHPWLLAFGRLADDATLQDARAELAALSGDLARENPGTDQGRRFTVASLRSRLAEPVRPALLVLTAVVGLVLLITCANVSNLVLVRSAGREREMALRISLGAGRGRLAGQLLAEGLLLALLGGVAGLALAVTATRAVVAMGAPGVPRLAELQVDGAVLAFTLLVSGILGVALGLVPLLRVSGADPSGSLREGARGGEGRRVRRTRRALVAGQLAVSTVLLVGAGLLVRSLANLTGVDTGVRPEGVLTLRVEPPQAAFPTPVDLRTFYDGLRDRLARLPEVEAVGGASQLPFTGWTSYAFTREGVPVPSEEDRPTAGLNAVEPGYFRSLGIPLVRGRLLDERDGGAAPPAILVDSAMVRTYFPDEDPLGQRITVRWATATGLPEEPPHEIVGVVGDVRHGGPASPPRPTMYVLRGNDAIPPWMSRTMWLTVRTGGEPATLASRAMRAVWDVDRTVPVTDVGPYGRFLDRHVSGTRNQTFLVGAFALLALVLASVGIAGVVAHAVARRGHEIGVRRALGAEGGEVVRLMVRESVGLVALGVSVGLVGAALGSRVLGNLLFGVRPADPLTYGAVGLGLAVVALVAAWIPARRAARVHPARALRAEG